MIFTTLMAAIGVFGAVLALPGTAFGVDEVRTRLGLDVAVQARLILLLFVGFFTGTLISGPLSDHVGRARVLAGSCTLLAAGLLGFAFATSLGPAAMAVLLLGWGGAGINTTTNTIASDLYPTRRGSMMVWLAWSVGLGGISMPLLALAGAAVSWTTVLVFAAAVAAACAGLALVLPIPRDEHAEALTWAGVKAAIGAKGFPRYVFALVCQGGNEAALAGWMTAYAISRGLPSDQALIVLTLHWGAVLVSRSIAASIVERVGKERLIIVSSALASLGTLVLVLAQDSAMLTAGAIASGFGLSGVFSTVMAAAGDRYQRLAGTMYGTLLTGAQVGGMIIPWSVGQIGRSAGLDAGLGLIVVTTAAVGVFIASARRVPVADAAG